jgi:ferredoxin
MEIALIGNNDKNKYLKPVLTENGFDVFLFPETEKINHIRSRENGFLIYTPDEKISKDYIIFTEKPVFNHEYKREVNKSWGKVYDITDNSIKEKDSKGLPVVFLLDIDGETDAEGTMIALKNAISIAKKLKKVYFISKTVRTGISGMEEMYLEARKSGVKFLKYTKADIDYDIDKQQFKLKVEDMFGSIGIETVALSIAGAGSMQDITAKILDDMKSKTRDNLDKYYLAGYKTSVNGIYILDGLTEEEDIKNLNKIIADIKKERQDYYINIDEGKCAFCYNCVRVCPHAALEPDYENSCMKPVKYKCNECGSCFSVCPANAITWKEDNKTAIEGKGLFIFACENSGAVLINELIDFTKKADIGISEISCGCRIRPQDILNALKSYEKVAVITCMDGACRHIDGTEKIEKTIKRAKDRMEMLGLNKDNIYHIKASWAMPVYIKESIMSVMEDGENT